MTHADHHPGQRADPAPAVGQARPHHSRAAAIVLGVAASAGAAALGWGASEIAGHAERIRAVEIQAERTAIDLDRVERWMVRIEAKLDRALESK